MESIISGEKECYVCRSPYVEKHHIYKGHKCRQIADDNGLWVWLCRKHHEKAHNDKESNYELMRLGQMKFELDHTRDEFMSLFGKNYL